MKIRRRRPRQLESASTAENGRVALRDMPARRIHPLLIFLLERGVGIGEGARMIGLSERMLRDVVGWKAQLSSYRGSRIAVDLGFASHADLFPDP